MYIYIYIVVPQYPWGISARIPAGIKICGCSSPLHKMGSVCI